MKRFSKFDAFTCFVLALLALSALSVGHRHQLHNRRQDGHHQSDDEDVESSEHSPEISGPRRPPLRRSVTDAGVDVPGDNESNESLAEQNCSHCGLRQAKRSYRVEAVKADILWKLRMNVPPNVTGRSLPDIPQIRRIIESHSHPSPGPDCSTHPTTTTSAEDYDDSFATTLKYVLFAQRGTSRIFHLTTAAFNLSNVTGAVVNSRDG